jgi:hypothetical protein
MCHALAYAANHTHLDKTAGSSANCFIDYASIGIGMAGIQRRSAQLAALRWSNPRCCRLLNGALARINPECRWDGSVPQRQLGHRFCRPRNQTARIIAPPADLGRSEGPNRAETESIVVPVV